ncbi:CBS domain-containing protein [Aggregicoccus sp. 17bor-14]|uniref:CBS domain-containing protein n=1 Tax=Myxococcaceae TaxID=31 RepID=UPI00129D0C8A|nr:MULTISPECIES: CBS domain-containing protein [Myxococcaceae]MBF5043076.1 CBS domain-containing protein [Simulacricoccus sp. 17bor-14]MRI88839.1 CBS domain-containing protein [Aggregicoccus sp. 17bor-14]
MANPKNPDLPRDNADTNRGLNAGSAGYDDASNGRSTRPQDTAGRQSYGMTGGLGSSGSSQRDFYREALSRGVNRRMGRDDLQRDFRGESRPYDRPEDYRSEGVRGENYGQGSNYGVRPERYAEMQGRNEGFRGQETYRTEEFQRGDLQRGDFQRGDWQRGNERNEGSHMPTGRTMALAAAGLGAVGAGLGLMRRGRWAKEPLCANDVMSRGVKTVMPEHTLREVARLMREENVGIVPVTDAQGRLLGVVTDRDLVVRAMSEDRMPSQVRVSDIMSSEDLEVATPEDALNDIIELMGRKQVRRIPVVERDNRLVGIIAMGDIATRAEFDEELQDALERISSRRSFWARLG